MAGEVEGVAAAIGSPSSGLTQEQFQEQFSEMLEAALAGRLRKDEPKTLLEMLQGRGDGQGQGLRQQAASSMMGAPGGIQYAKRELGGEIPKFLNIAGDAAKLAALV